MEKALEILKKYWGYSEFREGQESAISAVLNKEDVLSLLPTGGGKSICYQVPALMNEGICIVISPLIALMEDQINQLSRRNIRAIMVNSSMSKNQIDIALDNACYGDYKFLYIAPERIETRIFQERLKKMNVSLIAVDEAHCISEWGHDFRPAYFKISSLRERLPNTPIIAVTATATKKVVSDIEDSLQLKSMKLVESSFERSNIGYHISKSQSKHNDLRAILEKFSGETGIIYASTRKNVKETYDFLYSNGYSSTFYHGGLASEERKKRQNSWTLGETKIMVATNAFGMGIDKGDVRFVIHIEPPQNLESYFQEAGRAGRDNECAEAHLLYTDKDVSELRVRHEKSYPELSFIKKVYAALASHFQLATGSGKDERFSFDISHFSKNYKFDLFETYSALKILENDGYIYLSDTGPRSSSLYITADKSAVYSEQVKRKEVEVILNFILRTSIGAFDKYVGINEQKIAEKTGLTLAKVIQTLKFLDDTEIIDYLPASQKPEIIFTSEIITQNNLRISADAYINRKKVKADQLESLIGVLETTECIEKYTINYFGFEASDCGRCSNCKKKYKSTITKDSVLSKLEQNNSISLKELSSLTNPENSSELIEILRVLEDEGKISLSENGKRIEKK